MGIEAVRKASGEFAQKQKEGTKYDQKNYIRKREGIEQVPNDLRFRAVSYLPSKGTDDYDDSVFLWFLQRFRK